ncbi:hypothetical protein COBT_001144 [Conglomerata obtusa]
MNTKGFVSILLSIFLLSICSFALFIQPIANGTNGILTNQTYLPDIIHEVLNTTGNITLLAQQQNATELPEMDEIDPRNLNNITDVINKLAVEDDRHQSIVFDSEIQSNSTHPQGHDIVTKKPKKDLSLPKDTKNKKNKKNKNSPKTDTKESKTNEPPISLLDVVLVPRVLCVGDIEHKYYVYRKRNDINLYDRIKAAQALNKTFDEPQIPQFAKKLVEKNIQIYDSTDIIINGDTMLLVYKEKGLKFVYLSDKDFEASKDRFTSVSKDCKQRKKKKNAETKRCCESHATVSEITISFPGLISYEVFKTIKNECPNFFDKTSVRDLMDETVKKEYSGYRLEYNKN